MKRLWSCLICIKKIRRFGVIQVTGWISVYGLAVIQNSCHDFSKFDCFGEENGCESSSPIESSMPPLSTAPETMSDDPFVSWDQPISLREERAEDTPSVTDLCREPLACQQCDPRTGENMINDDDALCSPINCEALNLYELVEEGLCVERIFSPNDSLCQRGECVISPSQYCSLSIETRLDIKANLECKRILGCQGEIEPQTQIKTGELCNEGRGTCDATGVCIAFREDRSCLNIESNNLCNDNLDQGNCLYFVDLLLGLGILSSSSCDTFCATLGGRCEAAWNGNIECQQRRQRYCDTKGGQALCQCVF